MSDEIKESGEQPRSLDGLVGRNLKTIIEALWSAKLWEDSIADAHYFALSPHNRTPENKRIAMRSVKLGKRYEKLYDQLKAANDMLTVSGGREKTNGQ